MKQPPLPIGTETEYGTVEGVTLTRGERYYFLVGEDKVISLLPADVVEKRTQ